MENVEVTNELMAVYNGKDLLSNLECVFKGVTFERKYKKEIRDYIISFFNLTIESYLNNLEDKSVLSIMKKTREFDNKYGITLCEKEGVIYHFIGIKNDFFKQYGVEFLSGMNPKFYKIGFVMTKKETEILICSLFVDFVKMAKQKENNFFTYARSLRFTLNNYHLFLNVSGSYICYRDNKINRKCNTFIRDNMKIKDLSSLNLEDIIFKKKIDNPYSYELVDLKKIFFEDFKKDLYERFS